MATETGSPLESSVRNSENGILRPRHMTTYFFNYQNKTIYMFRIFVYNNDSIIIESERENVSLNNCAGRYLYHVRITVFEK